MELTNVELEKAFIGSLLLQPVQTLADTRNILKPSDISTLKYRTLYAAAIELADGQESELDITLIIGKAKTMQGGTTLLDGEEFELISSSTYTSVYAEDYAIQLAELSRRRLIISVCEKAAQAVHKPDKSTDEIIANVTKYLAGTGMQTEGVSIQDALGELWKAAQEAHDTTGEKQFIPSGLIDLDKLLGGGFYAGRTYIIGARPGAGKTSMLTQIALNAATARAKTCFISLEMTARDLVARMTAQEAGINAENYLSGRMTETDWYKLSNAISVMDYPIIIHDKPNQTPDSITATVSGCMRGESRGIALIDYMQKINVDGYKDGTRSQALGRASWAAKLIAKQNHIPVISAAQLNRGIENRTDAIPTLADLRETGDIENDADCVIMLYVPDNKQPDVIAALVRKNRFGKAGACRMRFDSEHTKFQNLSK
jgi:replicative DNA helicase